MLCTQILSFKFDEARYLQLKADTTSGPMPAASASVPAASASVQELDDDEEPAD